MFAITFLLLAITVLMGVMSHAASNSIAAGFMQTLVSAFGALFIISLALSIASRVGEKPTSS